jgi:hypothetical protein
MHRPLEEEIPYLILDARYEKVRQEGTRDADTPRLWLRLRCAVPFCGETTCLKLRSGWWQDCGASEKP